MRRLIRMFILKLEFHQEKKMPETFENIFDRFGWLTDGIRELIEGLTGYRLEKVKAGVPDVRRVIGVRLAQRPQRSVNRCDRY
jgi:hypothetical protein